jgi:trimethylamine:corrinoid methyltransferase-like protein
MNFIPSLLDRDSYDEWCDLGSPNMFTEANKKVKGILAAEPEHPLLWMSKDKYVKSWKKCDEKDKMKCIEKGQVSVNWFPWPFYL